MNMGEKHVSEKRNTFTAVTHKHKLHNHTPVCRESARSRVAVNIFL
jgi:hypothetical protein